MPYARFWLDGAPGTVSTVEGGASPMGKLLLMPVKGPTTSRIYPPKVFPKVKPPAGFADDLREPVVARERRAGLPLTRARTGPYTSSIVKASSPTSRNSV